MVNIRIYSTKYEEGSLVVVCLPYMCKALDSIPCTESKAKQSRTEKRKAKPNQTKNKSAKTKNQKKTKQQNSNHPETKKAKTKPKQKHTNSSQ